jgi:hypothetical protein
VKIHVKSRPPQIPYPRALHLQNVFYGCLFEPRKALMIEEILLATYKNPKPKGRYGRHFTRRRNLSKLSGTSHDDAPQFFEFAATQEL